MLWQKPGPPPRNRVREPCGQRYSRWRAASLRYNDFVEVFDADWEAERLRHFSKRGRVVSENEGYALVVP